MDNQNKPADAGAANQPTPAAAAPAQPLTIPPEVRVFLEGILQDAGMTIPDEITREEMIKELFVRLDHYITSVIIENLPPEHLDAFMKLNEEKKPMSEIQKFLLDKMPDTQEIFTRAFADFRDLYLGNVTTVRNAPTTPNAN